MPIFTLTCACGWSEEVIQGPHEETVPVPCEGCGSFMTRRDNRDYQADQITIIGDTCAGGQSKYDGYYDQGMGIWIKSKRHRAEEMKKRGLEEFSPSSDYVERRTESQYIRKHAPKGDPEAVRAIREQYRIADRKRKRRAIREAMVKKNAALSRD